MTDVLNSLLSPLSNAIMTCLVGISVLYWILTFIAGDFLGDIDVDLGMDNEEDNHNSRPGIFKEILAYINIDKVPIMLVISTFQLIAWILSLTISGIFNIQEFGNQSILILIPIFIITYFLTRFATKPFISIYNAMGYKGEKKLQLIGKIAIMKSTIEGDKIGDAEVVILNDVIRVMVKSIDGEQLNYHSEIILIEESEDKKFYWVKS